MTRKTFPIPASCSKCGHQADVFVDDEQLAKDLEAYRRSRFAALWRPLAVRRIFILAGVAFALGVLVGRFA